MNENTASRKLSSNPPPIHGVAVADWTGSASPRLAVTGPSLSTSGDRRATRGASIRLRWQVFLLILALTVVAYVQRTSVSVAGVKIMPDLHISQLQIGWLSTAFLFSYTVLMIPSSMLGQKVGPSRMITVCSVIAIAATLAVPLLPSLTSGFQLFACLIVAQLVLGASQAPLFPLTTGMLERWFPRNDWALTQGLGTAGVGLGSALAPPLIATLMVAVGWKLALAIAAGPIFLIVGLWWRNAYDAPDQHPSTTKEDLEGLVSHQERDSKPSLRSGLRLLANRDLLMLTLSYFAFCIVFFLIVFWSFLYLVQARHFTLLQGGFAATAPFLAGAAGSALGGVTGKRFTVRFGARIGLRLTPFLTLPLAGAMLFLAVHATDAVLAVVGLSLAFGLLEMSEASFWAASMGIGKADAAAAGAILNTVGNIGGIVATPFIAFVSGHGDWNTPFILGAVFAIVSALLWSFVNCERKQSPTASPLGAGSL